MPPAPPSPRSTRDDQLVVALAVVAAVAAGLAPGRLTGLDAVDALYRAVLGGGMAIVTARARRWTWLVLGGVAAASAHGPLALAAWAALALALAAAVRPDRVGAAGAAGAALAVPVLLRQEGYGFQGLPLVVGAVAVLPALVSGYRRFPTRARRRIGRALWGVGAAAAVSVALAGVAVVRAAGPLRSGADEARAALGQVRAGQTDDARRGLGRARTDLDAATGFLDAPWAQPARMVPLVSQQLRALSTVAASGAEVGRSGAALAEVGDYRDLRYRSGRLDVARVEALVDPLDTAAVVLDEQAGRLRSIDRDWLVGPLRRQLDDADRSLDRAAGDAQVAASTVRVLPGLLGGDGDRHYLVAFLNPAEERGLGGFFGNYAELSASDGEVRLVRAGSSAEIEPARPSGTRTLDGPDEYLDLHGTTGSAATLLDASSSPHYPHSVDVMTQIFEQTSGTRLDGVIAMDAYTVAALLKLTGPIRVPGHPTALTGDNAADVLVRQQYLDYAAKNADRKDLLQLATEMAFDQLLQGDLPAPKKLIAVLGPMVRERRLLLHAQRTPEQRLFERIGADGGLPVEASGDVFLVAHQNVGNSRIDTYLHRTVAYGTVVDAATGSVSTTATITLRNDAPAEGLPDHVIGNSWDEPTGTNLVNLLVYSRLRPTSVRVDGERRDFRVGPEAGLQATSLRIRVPAGATVELVVELEGAADLGSGPYTVRVVPQPMVHPDHVSASIRVRRGSVAPVAGSPLQRAGASLVLPDTVAPTPIELAVEITADD